MHCSLEGVLVQEMWCEEVIEVGRGGKRGGGVAEDIYRMYSGEQYIIYSCMYSGYWWGDQLGSVIYIGCAMYRNVSYSR